LIFLAAPIEYLALSNSIYSALLGDNYKVWLDILLLLILVIVPFGVTLWFSYKPIFISKVFPWTFCSESLLLLFIVLRDKLAFDSVTLSWVSVLSYFIVQIYSYHYKMYMIPLENLVFLIIYLIVYNDVVFQDNPFALNEPLYFFPVYLVRISIYKLNINKDIILIWLSMNITYNYRFLLLVQNLQ